MGLTILYSFMFTFYLYLQSTMFYFEFYVTFINL